jgi:uncharacterized protein (DUF1330 family)
MPAYLIALVDIRDPEAYRAYTERSPAVISKYNGRILARGGQVTSLEGEPFKGRAVIIEFPSLKQVEDFYASSDYQEVKRFRDGAAIARFIAVQGID